MTPELKAKLMDEYAGKKLVAIRLPNPDPVIDEKIEVIVTPPSRIQWKRFTDEIKNDKTAKSAGPTLLQSCLVLPKGDDFKLLEEEYPGIVSTVLNKLSDLAGIELEAEIEFLK